MADNTARGRFVWHELMTPNNAGAHVFYTNALGWKTESWDQDPSYTMFAASTGPLAGSFESHEGAPYWIPYVSVPDVYTTAEQAKDLGGAVVTQPASMPNGGRHASLTDPQGALFGIYSSPDDMGPDTAAEPGEFSWHELSTTDNRAAFDFYSALFGWALVLEHDMGPMGVYLIFGRNGRQVGGMLNKGDVGKPGPAYWLNYVRVEDVNGTVKKVEAERGSLVNGPMEVPGGDLIAQFIDPYGALFAVHTVASEVKTAAKQAAPQRETEEQSGTEPVSRKSAKKSAKKSGSRDLREPAARRKAADRAEPETAQAAPKSTRIARKKSAKKSAKKSGKKTSAVSRKSTGTKAASNKKRAGKKAAGKKAAGKKAAGKKTAGKKTAGKKAAGKKAAGKKTASKKVGGKKSAGKKATGKKRAAKKTTKKAGGRKTSGKKAGGKKAGARKSAGRKAKKKSATKKSTAGKTAKKRSKNKRSRN